MFSSVSGAKLYTKMHQPLPFMAAWAGLCPPDGRRGFPARTSPAIGAYLKEKKIYYFEQNTIIAVCL
jgi:hypothetical protein